jgi:hypothetical protein
LTFKIGVLTTTAAAALISGCVAESPVLRAERESFKSIDIGVTADQVIRRLGEPRHRYDRQTAPDSYYVKGYSYKERPISQSVLIYVGIESILCVYVDANNRVEDVFVGGS